MAYTSLTAASLGDDVILTSTTMQALNDNPIAIAQRMTNAPVVQVPVLDVKTSGTAATWTWPDKVTAVKITIVGGGGGGSGVGDTNGGESSIVYNSVTVTANGGLSDDNGGTGGSATNGTLNFSGQGGNGGGAPLGFGFGAKNGISASGYGGGAFGAAGNGGGGGLAIYRVNKVDGLNTITYTVGAAGATGNSGTGAASPGIIIFEY